MVHRPACLPYQNLPKPFLNPIFRPKWCNGRVFEALQGGSVQLRTNTEYYNHNSNILVARTMTPARPIKTLSKHYLNPIFAPKWCNRCVGDRCCSVDWCNHVFGNRRCGHAHSCGAHHALRATYQNPIQTLSKPYFSPKMVQPTRC